MKYLAVIFLVVLGMVEFLVRIAGVLLTFFFVIFLDDWFEVRCWNMAEQIIRRG